MNNPAEFQIELLCKALQIAATYARENLPAMFPDGEDAKDYVSIYAGGVLRDPQGYEFISFWLQKAEKSLTSSNNLFEKD